MITTCYIDELLRPKRCSVAVPPFEDDMTKGKAFKFVIKGPSGSPYENGYFHFTITYRESIICDTQIFHPNFDAKGNLHNIDIHTLDFKR